VVRFALTVSVGIENAVVNHPEVLGLGVDVDQRDYPNTSDGALVVAGPLIASRFYLGSEPLVEDGVVEDQVRILLAFQKWLNLLEEQTRRELLAFKITVYGVVAEMSQMLGEVGQGVVDLARE
jgi:hypothetical protein